MKMFEEEWGWKFKDFMCGKCIVVYVSEIVDEMCGVTFVVCLSVIIK